MILNINENIMIPPGNHYNLETWKPQFIDNGRVSKPYIPLKIKYRRMFRNK